MACGGERWTIAWHAPAETFLLWEAESSSYRPLSHDDLRGVVRSFFRTWKRVDAKTGEHKPSGLATAALNEIIDAMKVEIGTGIKALPGMARATFFADGNPMLTYTPRLPSRPPEQVPVIAARNGLLYLDDIREGRVRLRKPTTRYICTNTLPYDIDAPTLQRAFDGDPDCEGDGAALCETICPVWMSFLRRVWDGDEISQRCLQQAFGYTLTSDRSQEKLFFLPGPPRSGKGITTDALSWVVGEENVAVTSLLQIYDRFTAATFVGKSVILLDEVAAGSKTDSVEATRSLKSMSGGTRVPVERKYKDHDPFAEIYAKVWMTANELARLPDPSGAMCSRMVVIPTTVSFVGREDTTLKRRIKAEAAGILHWALFGLRSLCKVGKFIMPSEGEMMVEKMRRMAAPVQAFLQDGCVTGRGHGSLASVLYKDYKAWAEYHGHSDRLTLERFGSMLLAGGGVHETTMETPDGPRTGYEGVRPWMWADRLASGELPKKEEARPRITHVASELTSMEWRTVKASEATDRGW